MSSVTRAVPRDSMSGGTGAPGRAAIGARTLRTDNWRRAPLLTFTLLSLWVLYAALRTVSQHAYFAAPEHYLSPFASPCVTASCNPAARDFGTWFGHFPPIIPFAIVTLPFLLGFRLTCYYYRRAYYRAFWASPPACAVAEPHRSYSGETRFPLIFQNLHRYFFGAAVIISLVNTWDVVQAFRPEGHALRVRPRHHHHADQRGPALGLHGVVPLVPPHRRRPAAQLLPAPDPVQGVGVRLPAQREAHAAGLDRRWPP